MQFVTLAYCRQEFDAISMIRQWSFALIILLLPFTPAVSETLLDTKSWKTGNENLLNQSSVEVVGEFISEKLPHTERFWDFYPQYIKDFKWIDLNADGNLELLVRYLESRFRYDLFTSPHRINKKFSCR